MVFVFAVTLIRSLFGLNKEIYTRSAAIFYKPYLVHKYQSKLQLDQFLKQDQSEILNFQETYVSSTDDSNLNQNQYQNEENETGQIDKIQNNVQTQEDEKSNNNEELNTTVEKINDTEEIIEETEINIAEVEKVPSEYEILIHQENYYDMAEEDNILTLIVHNQNQNITNLNNSKFLNSSDYSLISIQSDVKTKKANLFGKVSRSKGFWSIPGSHANFDVKIKKEKPINGFTFSYNNTELCSPQSFKLTLNDTIPLLEYNNINNHISNVTVIFDYYIYAKDLLLNINQNKGGNTVCLNDFYILPYDYTFK